MNLEYLGIKTPLERRIVISNSARCVYSATLVAERGPRPALLLDEQMDAYYFLFVFHLFHSAQIFIRARSCPRLLIEGTMRFLKPLFFLRWTRA